MTGAHLSMPDYLVIGGYFVIVLWIGFYFRSRLDAAKDYFAGGHQVPWWLAGISHYMSSFSAFSFIAYAQMGYMYGWVAVTLFWATIPGCLAGALFFARRWRRARVITPVQFLESRFNSFVRQLFAWSGIPMKVLDDALKIFATGLFVSASTGFNLQAGIAVCGLVMVAYTFLGGLWALVVTDYVQFLMKAMAILLLLPLAIVAAGGVQRAFAGLPEGFFEPTGGPYGISYIAGFIVLMMISYNASWSLAQKYYSVRDEKEAAKTAYCAAALNLVGAPLMILPALIGRHFLPDLIAQQRTADVYILLVVTLLPVGMIGIIVAAMFSATMAVVSADFNAIASVLTKDVYHRLFRPEASDMQLLRVGRWATLMLGLVTTLLSLWIAALGQQALFNTMVTLLGLFMAPTFLPLLAGLASRRLTARGALVGFFAGLVTGFVMLAVKTWWLPLQPNGTSVGTTYAFEGVSLLTNAAVTLIGMVIGTASGRRDDLEARRAVEFFEALDRPIAADEIPRAAANAALPILGLSTVGVGALLALAGLLAESSAARICDLAIGVLLMAVGALLHRRGRRAVGIATAVASAS
jgi:SSS family solute:Na+ symporter